MKNVIITIIALVISISSFGQKKHKALRDTLIWNQDYSLKKVDFQGKKTGTKFSVTSSMYIMYYVTEIDGDLKIKAEAVFNKSKSVMKVESAYALRYEQIYFDITELYARKFRKKLSETDFLKIKDVKAKISKDFKKIDEELGDEKNRFAKDTQNGLNAAKLDLWNQNIQTQLKELDQYISTEVGFKKDI